MNLKTYSQLVAELLASVGEHTPLTNFNVGSVIRTLTEGVAEVVGELYAFASDMLKQGFLDTTSGVWLNRKAAEYGVTRNPAIRTEGTVIFSRAVPRTTNVPIPDGSVVATPRDQSGSEYRYLTTDEAILSSGETSVAVPVQAEEAGSAWNVGSGSITRMKTYLTGVDAVTNEADWITIVGADQEDDEALRLRCYLAWEELAQGGTAAAYVSWALSVPGVTSAFVDDDLPRGEGTVDIYIMGEAGPPDAALLEAVQSVIDERRPITADALVRAPDAVVVPIHLVVTPRAGYELVALDTEIRRRLGVLFGDIDDPSLGITPLGVGKDVVVARLIALVMAIPGVYSVTILEPAADVVVASNQVPDLGDLTIDMEAPSYE
jgi:uncharacterized phage protein gp47/JayE